MLLNVTAYLLRFVKILNMKQQDIDFAVLCELHASKNIDLPYKFYEQFNLDHLEEEECSEDESGFLLR